MFGKMSSLAGVRLVLRAGLAGIMLILAAGFAIAQSLAENPAKACSLEHLKDSAKVGQFLFRSYKSDDDSGCLVVLHAGKIIFRRTVDSFDGYTLGQRADKEQGVPAIANGTDITGRGRPDMIVSLYTGGAHCCTIHYVFELEPDFKLLATLDAEDSWPAYFADLDGDHHYYYLADDWTFAYWPNCFACSPWAPIKLRFVEDGKAGSYHLALDKMRQPEPTPTEWGKSLQETRKTFSEPNWELSIGTTLWDTELKLIYAGHADLAWKFLDEAWPAKVKGKSEWLGNFCSRLKTSPYWPDLEPVVRDAPSACANAKPGPGER
jgi:hypothetical protein